jgi:hypothetical protein
MNSMCGHRCPLFVEVLKENKLVSAELHCINPILTYEIQRDLRSEKDFIKNKKGESKDE